MSGIIESYQRKFDTNKIFLSSQQIVVYWAHITVIKAELICFEDLLEFPGGHPLTTWTKRGYRNVNESSHVGKDGKNIREHAKIKKNKFMDSDMGIYESLHGLGDSQMSMFVHITMSKTVHVVYG